MHDEADKITLYIAFVQLGKDSIGVLLGQNMFFPAIGDHIPHPLLAEPAAKVQLDWPHEYVD